jgi:hypothetical protein
MTDPSETNAKAVINRFSVTTQVGYLWIAYLWNGGVLTHEFGPLVAVFPGETPND